jgi:hypothetical protein
MKTAHRLDVICILVFNLLMPPLAWATDQQDLSVALRTLPLLTNKMTGAATVAVIYDPVSAESKADADKIKSIIDHGLEAPGDIKLTARLTSTAELSTLSGAKIAFLAHGLPVADYSAVSAAASSASVLTICTDIDCVKTNQCVLGVTSGPHMEVYYSPVAAAAANIGFASAFTMLAKQVGSM